MILTFSRSQRTQRRNPNQARTPTQDAVSQICLGKQIPKRVIPPASHAMHSREITDHWGKNSWFFFEEWRVGGGKADGNDANVQV